jgi:transketolase
MSRADIEKANRQAWNDHLAMLKEVLIKINGAKRRTKAAILREATELATSRSKNTATTSLAAREQQQNKRKRRQSQHEETPDEKRRRINASEQARRDETKNCLEALKAAVPALAGKSDVTKNEIVATATEYLRDLYT